MTFNLIQCFFKTKKKQYDDASTRISSSRDSDNSIINHQHRDEDESMNFREYEGMTFRDALMSTPPEQDNATPKRGMKEKTNENVVAKKKKRVMRKKKKKKKEKKHERTSLSLYLSLKVEIRVIETRNTHTREENPF